VFRAEAGGKKGAGEEQAARNTVRHEAKTSCMYVAKIRYLYR
jgi:hypothetical protein